MSDVSVFVWIAPRSAHREALTRIFKLLVRLSGVVVLGEIDGPAPQHVPFRVVKRRVCGVDLNSAFRPGQRLLKVTTREKKLGELLTYNPIVTGTIRHYLE